MPSDPSTPTHGLRPRLPAALAAAAVAAGLVACELPGGPPDPTYFEVPIAGEAGVDWWYGALPNHAREQGGVEDYLCGLKTLEFHAATDFVLPSFVEMDAGVAVLAAAAGEVVEVRDGEYDRRLGGQFGAEGNRVLIRHADGYASLYRNLAAGSIAVAVGDRVSAGQAIARVGSSGDSEWPHLGFEARTPEGVTFDPWAGACSGSDTFWAAQPDYPIAFHVVDSGTTDQAPSLVMVANGPRRVSAFPRGTSFTFWAHTVNRPAGVMTLELLGPGDAVRDSTAFFFPTHDPANIVYGGTVILAEDDPLGDWAIRYAMAGDSVFARMDFQVVEATSGAGTARGAGTPRGAVAIPAGAGARLVVGEGMRLPVGPHALQR